MDSGANCPSPRPRQFPRDLFLRAICAIYAVAFASIGGQIRGLYGEDGLEPVGVFLRRLVQNNADLAQRNAWSRMWVYPTLVWFHDNVGCTPVVMMQFLALVGTTMALRGVYRASSRTTMPMLLLWICYLSLTQVGQTFMRFQWDSFLLEVGFLSTWLAPWWECPLGTFEPPAAVIWTIRYLFFKFMLMSGAVKIQSRCPTWLGLTALEFHFATQPLPLPLSWYGHQLPPILNRIGVALTLLIEGPWTFLIIAPALVLRQISAIVQIILQVAIILTGNYNFFNVLTVVMALTGWDCVSSTRGRLEVQGALGYYVARVEDRWRCLQDDPTLRKSMIVAALSYAIYTFIEVFEVGVSSNAETVAVEDFFEVMWIRYKPSVEETQAWLARVLPIAVMASASFAVIAGLIQIIRIWNLRYHSRSSKIVALLYLAFTMLVSSGIFCSSTLTLSVLDRPFQQSLPPIMLIMYSVSEKWRITSAYGLFRTMTGVGYVERNGVRHAIVARPEIILEGTRDNGITWEPYHFKYKPGDVFAMPKVNIPLQPRLDWQMWFAALGDYQGAPWIVHLVDKLLRGSEGVKALLDTSRDPFPKQPPQAIRAHLYAYDYTRLNTSWNRKVLMVDILNSTNDTRWWSRSFLREYLPALERGNPSLEAFVQHHFGHVDVVEGGQRSSMWKRWFWRVIERFGDRPILGALALNLAAILSGQVRQIIRATMLSPKARVH